MATSSTAVRNACELPGCVHRAKDCAINLACKASGVCQSAPRMVSDILPMSKDKTIRDYTCDSTCSEGCPGSEIGIHTRKPLPNPIIEKLDREIMSALPTDKQARKDTPVCTGVLDYFPAALAEIARVSKAGNDQHNPGQPLHWARGKSMDHADCITRHLMERGSIDTDGMRHSAKMAWRALALLQQELEDAGAPISRASKTQEESE